MSATTQALGVTNTYRCTIGRHDPTRLEWGHLDSRRPGEVIEDASLKQAMREVWQARTEGATTATVHRERQGDWWHTVNGAGPERWHSQQGSAYLQRHPEWDVDGCGWVIDPTQRLHRPRAYDHGAPLAMFGRQDSDLVGCGALAGHCSSGNHSHCRFGMWEEHAPDQCLQDHPWRCGCACHYLVVTEPVQDALFELIV